MKCLVYFLISLLVSNFEVVPVVQHSRWNMSTESILFQDMIFLEAVRCHFDN